MEGESIGAAERVDVVVVVVEGVVVVGVVGDVPPAAALTLTAIFMPPLQCPGVAQMK